MAKKFEKVSTNNVVVKTVEKTGIDMNTVEAISTAFLESISDYLKIGFVVNIKDFGKMFSFKKPARTARNPRTGEKVNVVERRIIKFVPATGLVLGLKKSVNEKSPKVVDKK